MENILPFRCSYDGKKSLQEFKSFIGCFAFHNVAASHDKILIFQSIQKCFTFILTLLGLLAFKCDDEGEEKLTINNAMNEAALTKKRRHQQELTHALGVLGVKHSTFHSMLKRNEHPQVRKMLKAHLKVMLVKETKEFFVNLKNGEF